MFKQVLVIASTVLCFACEVDGSPALEPLPPLIEIPGVRRTATLDGEEITERHSESFHVRYYSDGTNRVSWRSQWETESQYLSLSLRAGSVDGLKTGTMTLDLSDRDLVGLYLNNPETNFPEKSFRTGKLLLTFRDFHDGTVDIEVQTEGAEADLHIHHRFPLSCVIPHGVNVLTDDPQAQPGIGDDKFETEECQELKRIYEAFPK